VNITSDYYDAWADYAKSLIYTKVTSNKTKNTVSIELTVAPSTLGGATEITNPINLRGLPSDDNTPLDNFSFIIYTDGMNKWDLRAKNGNRSFIIYLDQFNRLSIGYRDTDISTTGETWGPSAPYPDLHDEEGEDYIYVDLLSNSTYLNYSNVNNIGADNSAECKVYTSQFSGIRNPADSWTPPVINTSNNNAKQSLFNITQHYTWKMAEIKDISFGECVPSGKKLPGDGSTVTLGYNTTGGITFLHITNNTADVSLT
jgi:hypothetical protein